MFKIIEDRVSIRDDYNGKNTIGFLNKGEMIYPLRIINNWAMILNNDKYAWVRLYDDKKHYALELDGCIVCDKSSSSFKGIADILYINDTL